MPKLVFSGSLSHSPKVDSNMGGKEFWDFIRLLVVVALLSVAVWIASLPDAFLQRIIGKIIGEPVKTEQHP